MQGFIGIIKQITDCFVQFGSGSNESSVSANFFIGNVEVNTLTFADVVFDIAVLIFNSYGVIAAIDPFAFSESGH